MVGTHAFEVILNKLGVRAMAFATLDVDVARAAPLALNDVPSGGMLEILRGSGIVFDEVPNFDHPKGKDARKNKLAGEPEQRQVPV